MSLGWNDRVEVIEAGIHEASQFFIRREAGLTQQVLAEAQIQATLLLAEQQRLANIIALAHVADSSDATVTPMEREAWCALGLEGEGTMRPEIRAALRLEEDHG